MKIRYPVLCAYKDFSQGHVRDELRCIREGRVWPADGVAERRLSPGDHLAQNENERREGARFGT